MPEPHIFIVRLWAAQPPARGFRGTVRAIQAEETTPVQTPAELAASLLLGLALPGQPAVQAPPRVAKAVQATIAAAARAGSAGAGLGIAIAIAIAIGLPLLAAALWLPAGLPGLHWLPDPPPAVVLPLVLLAATGLLSGFLSGLLGIGGALVVVPALYLLLPWLGVAADRLPHVAVGTSLVAMLPTALAATLAQHRRGGIDTIWFRRLSPGLLVGAAVGVLLAMQLRGPALSLLFAAQSFYYGWGLMRAAPSVPGGFRAGVVRTCARAPGWLASALIAAFCSCAGMGAGSLTVPYMTNKGVGLLRAAGTSCALNLCIAVGGGLALHLSQAGSPGAAPAASVSWAAAAILGGSAVLSVRQGVALAHRLPVDLFRKTLGCVTLLGAAVLTVRTVWISV